MLQRQDKNAEVISLADADADADAQAGGDVSDCSEGGSDKVSREKVLTPQLFDFEVEIISALKDDPRLVEIEVAERK